MSAELDELVTRYGASAARFMQQSDRVSFTAPLFNVPGRLVLGGHCFLDHAPDYLAMVRDAVDPTELGRRMRRPGSRPNYVNLSAVMLGYLDGREQRGLVAGAHPDEVLGPDSVERTRTVVAFWRDAMVGYLDGAPLLPEDRDGALLLLEPAELLASTESLSAPDDPAVRRLFAVAELYTFALNGEARVGVLHHGPYAGPTSGTTVIVKELVGLRDDPIGWSLPTMPPFDALVRIQVVRDVDASVDLFGSLHVSPADFADRVVGDQVLTVDGDHVAPFDRDQAEALTTTFNDRLLEIYRQAVAWDPYEQVAYGSRLYAGLLRPFTRAAGLDVDEQLARDFDATARRVTPGLASGEEPLLILEKLGASQAPFTPPITP